MTLMPVADDADTVERAAVDQQIREAILGGEFAPHQRLIEADLSDRFAATRAAVRTALLTLASEGLVERLPNRGARVRAISVEEAIEIVEVRVGLESLCARKAAERVDADAIEWLRDLRDRIGSAVSPGCAPSVPASSPYRRGALRPASPAARGCGWLWPDVVVGAACAPRPHPAAPYCTQPTSLSCSRLGLLLCALAP